MTLQKRISSIGRTAKLSITALALAGGLAAVAPATAAAAPAAIQAVHSVQASWICNYTTLGPSRVALTCTVYSGAIRLRIQCPDGRVIGTPWWGAGSWYLVIDCSPVATWVETRG
ncbi:hypothetical protein [Amycolatopsis sp. MtRt-6]|uniref:hypothetical protein n=1 Tax=Amycolatopsis sp. MtRt-6 TaxID=2792782 RepID=UPI001A8C6E7F|nr:hypothetical protein [Amycolatopsis sp. MtRt-6]